MKTGSYFACLLNLIVLIQGWNVKPTSTRPVEKAAIGRKTFLVGTVGAIVTGTALEAPGTALAIDSKQSNKKKGVYEPAPNSLTDQVILITGGSTGLGLESAKRLAAAGATIILTSRTAAKGEAAVESVRNYLTENGISSDSRKIYNLVLDLDDLDSVRAFPDAVSKLNLGKKIDTLMNNAGVMAIPDLQLTKDGYERTFQSNHLGHFLLTAELIPYLNLSDGTIINVSSEAYNFASKTTGGKGLDLDNLNGETKYGPWSSYGQSKLANILFTRELQRRANEAGYDGLTVVSLHPGAVQTDLGRNIVGEEKWNTLKTKGPSGLEAILLNAASAFTLTVPEGASTQVFLASVKDKGTLKKGAFYEDMEEKNLPGWATSDSDAKALWQKSEELAGIKFTLAKEEKKAPETAESDASTPAAM